MKGRLSWCLAGLCLLAVLGFVLCSQRFSDDWPGLGGLRRGLTVVELANYDQRLRLRSPRAPDPRIVVVAIDFPSVSNPKFGAMPWDRAIHARLIEQLSQAGAALIVFDISFAHRQAQAEDSETRLVEACRRSGKVVLGTFVDYQTRFDAQTGDLDLVPVHHPLPPRLAEAVGYEKGIGQTWAQRDLDQGLRLLWLRRSLDGIEGAVDPHLHGVDLLTLAAVAAQRVTGHDLLLDRQSGSWQGWLGQRAIPMWPAAPIVLLDYPGNPYPVYSYVDVVERKISPDFKDKIVVVGSTSDIADAFVVPRNPRNRRGQLPGCFAHAVLLDTLLNGPGIGFLRLPLEPTPVSPWLSGLVPGLLLAGLSALAHWRWPLNRALAAALGLAAGYCILTAMLLLNNLYLNTTVPLLLLGLFQIWALAREPAQIRTLLRAFIPREHVETLLQDSGALSRQNQLQEATILFVDIRDYTVLSERIPPEEVRRLVSRFHDCLAQVFARHGGYVCDFQGDAQMIGFGVTPQRPDHAHCAIQAASELPAAVAELNAALLKEVPQLAENGIVFRFGVGICSGPVSVGYLQGGGKLQHTVLGDTTNTAARLQGKARDLGVVTVVSNTTVERAPHWLPRLRELPPVELKGKAEPHRVYELLAESCE